MINRDSDNLKYLLVRVLIALVFLGASAFLVKQHIISPVVGMLPFLVGALLIVPPILSLVTRTSGSFYFPKSGKRQTNLMFSIAESRIMEGKYDEALSLYKEMIPKDHKRLEIYMRTMNLAVDKMKQPGIATDTFHTGLKNITNRQDKKALTELYEHLTGA